MKPFVHICVRENVCQRFLFFQFVRKQSSRSDHFRPTTVEDLHHIRPKRSPSDLPRRPVRSHKQWRRKGKGSGNNLDFHVPQSKTVRQLHPLSMWFCILSAPLIHFLLIYLWGKWDEKSLNHTQTTIFHVDNLHGPKKLKTYPYLSFSLKLLSFFSVDERRLWEKPDSLATVG